MILILQVLMFVSAFVGLIAEKMSKRNAPKSSGMNSPDGSLELVGSGFASDKHVQSPPRAY